MAMVNTMLNLSSAVKDSRWLTLEVCREYQRNKCSRTENECKFAHPPPHVEVQNGRVTACFDSIKGKCQRKDPPCKYLHPPQHLREQLLQNGRNNLILRNLQMQAAQQAALQPLMPIQTMAHPYLGSIPTSMAFNPYATINQGNVQTVAVPGGGDTTMVTSPLQGVLQAIPSQQKMASSRPDRLEQGALPGVIPYKRVAVADGKSGLPMYHPGANFAYQQALQAMQLQQQYVPATSYTNKSGIPVPTQISQSSPLQQAMQIPQQHLVPVTLAGHPPSLPRF
ncbi:Protein muscleblind [Mizuhopecten yessoensis]|uniref:Protein muscleblind n=1 Tax=Mizuhopecten yessoensis TaxID=6573 RepID=A0A210QC37_MIZYE|nr:Protein muscleblind [Mizuhopecten yessoensis]